MQINPLLFFNYFCDFFSLIIWRYENNCYIKYNLDTGMKACFSQVMSMFGLGLTLRFFN